VRGPKRGVARAPRAADELGREQAAALLVAEDVAHAGLAEVVHAIALNKRTVLPVSTLQQGAYGLRNVSISVPTVVGRAGALAHIEVELWPKELSGLQSSARALQETYAKVAKA
jgi:malate/lactate dehydrogenase